MYRPSASSSSRSRFPAHPPPQAPAQQQQPPQPASSSTTPLITDTIDRVIRHARSKYPFVLDCRHMRSQTLSFIIGHPDSSSPSSSSSSSSEASSSSSPSSLLPAAALPSDYVYHPLAIFTNLQAYTSVCTKMKLNTLVLILIPGGTPTYPLKFYIFLATPTVNLGVNIPIQNREDVVLTILDSLVTRAFLIDNLYTCASLFLSPHEKATGSIDRFRDACLQQDPPLLLTKKPTKAQQNKRTFSDMNNPQQPLDTRPAIHNYELVNPNAMGTYAKLKIHSTWNVSKRDANVYMYGLYKEIKNTNANASSETTSKVILPFSAEEDRGLVDFLVIEACSVFATGQFFIIPWSQLEANGYFSRDHEGGRMSLQLQLTPPLNPIYRTTVVPRANEIEEAAADADANVPEEEEKKDHHPNEAPPPESRLIDLNHEVVQMTEDNPDTPVFRTNRMELLRAPEALLNETSIQRLDQIIPPRANITAEQRNQRNTQEFVENKLKDLTIHDLQGKLHEVHIFFLPRKPKVYYIGLLRDAILNHQIPFPT